MSAFDAWVIDKQLEREFLDGYSEYVQECKENGVRRILDFTAWQEKLERELS